MAALRSPSQDGPSPTQANEILDCVVALQVDLNNATRKATQLPESLQHRLRAINEAIVAALDSFRDYISEGDGLPQPLEPDVKDFARGDGRQ